MAPYITVEGEQTLRAELEQLWRIERPRVTQSVSEAAAQGDRSENAEYIYGKKRLREIDSRVRFLRKRLEVLKVVRELPTDVSKVYFGAWIALEDEKGNLAHYRLVGPDELNPALGYISIDSVLGRALLGKARDSEISINTPTGKRDYVIIDVCYSPPAGAG
jgi:transcription elongation factor GreB